MTGQFLIGDALEVLRGMPDASVDLVLTSPPFLALRSYLSANHLDKSKEMGSEQTPGAYLDHLLDVVEELRRVLAPHGSLCIELGDTYSGSGGAGGDYTDTGLRAGQEKFNGSALQHRRSAQRNRKLDGWPLAKSLTMIPESLRFALAYGRNPWTGRETSQWRIRNVVRWVRPNPPVGALADKWRPATTDILVACVGRKRYFDMEAVRKEPAYGFVDQKRPSAHKLRDTPGRVPQMMNPATENGRINSNAGGAPPFDWLLVPPEGYKGSHYATWPRDLLVPFIACMCPQKVCRVCGKPSERIVEKNLVPAPGGTNGTRRDLKNPDGGGGFIGKPTMSSANRTLGWTNCGHDDYRAGMVLDPFAGSGTTLAVATGMGRDAIGIDLDERNLELARQRVGMFLVGELE